MPVALSLAENVPGRESMGLANPYRTGDARPVWGALLISACGYA